jgi:acyl-CoA reductase-like NAD-dependent aldehyde dehydrogenase
MLVVRNHHDTRCYDLTAQVPDGVFNVVVGRVDTGQALVKHPLVSKVDVTVGSLYEVSI